MLQKYCEEYSKHSRSKHAALFDSASDVEVFGSAAIELNNSLYVGVEGLNQAEQDWRTFSLGEDLEEATAA